METDLAILENLKRIFENVANSAAKANRSADEISVMAVTKTVPAEKVNFAVEHGIKLLGENRVQEFLEKDTKYILKKDKIHFIGHLQSNKVKYIIDKVSMIESVSSLSLAGEIDRLSEMRNLIMPVLLEVNISNEETKGGFLENEVIEAIYKLLEYKNIHIEGLMVIPSRENTEYWFRKTQELFNEIKSKQIDGIIMKTLSMGMSHDYENAVICGSTTVRLGSAVFGKRNIGGI